ncbi:MAG: DUF4199 domain-containing protein [Bacteroidota bacterium]
MEESGKSPEIQKLALKHGILMMLALVGYFFLMKAFSLDHHLELRALNLIILFSFVFTALKSYKKRNNNQLPYLAGIQLGMLTSVIGVISFAVLVFVYVTVLVPDFMVEIKEQEPFGQFLNPFLVMVTIVIEGLSSGFLASYASLQYLRPSRLEKKVKVRE